MLQRFGKVYPDTSFEQAVHSLKNAFPNCDIQIKTGTKFGNIRPANGTYIQIDNSVITGWALFWDETGQVFTTPQVGNIIGKIIIGPFSSMFPDFPMMKLTATHLTNVFGEQSEQAA